MIKLENSNTKYLSFHTDFRSRHPRNLRGTTKALHGPNLMWAFLERDNNYKITYFKAL